MDDNLKAKYDQALIQIKRLEIEREAVKQITQACVNVYEQTGIFCAFNGNITIEWDIDPKDIKNPVVTFTPGMEIVEKIVEQPEVISKEQKQMLEREAGRHTEIIRALLRQCDLESLAFLPKSKYYNALEYIRKNVAAKENRAF